jgi:hypothetical protein
LSFIQLYRWFPSVLKAITIIRSETLVRSPCTLKRSDPRIPLVQHPNCQLKYVGFQVSLNRAVAAATTPFPQGAKVP